MSSNITQTIIASDISVTDCKEKCVEDKDCHSFEADCADVSMMSYWLYGRKI